MNILCIDVDSLAPRPSKGPNLALMKISAFHKAKGDKVYLNRCLKPPDKVYISCIFQRNRPMALGIAKMFNCEVEIGGYGVNDKQLPDVIEHQFPDYSLYGIKYSMGFTSRGCIRKCPWCLVWRKEGYIREHAPIDEFYVPRWRKLLLLDNNFLASPKWYEKLREIIIRKIKVSFNQGLDIRLINEENAEMLAKTLYYDIDFNERRLYFSFDTLEIEKAVRKGVELLTNAGIPPKHLMFYMLCGFCKKENYNFIKDWIRFKTLLELGVDPYVMKYNGRTDIPVLNHFSRWVIKRDYKRKKPKYLRPKEWNELKKAIMEIEGSRWLNA